MGRSRSHSRSRSRSRRRRHSRSRSGSRDSSPEVYRVHVADLCTDPDKREIERKFEKFGPIIEVWIARNPPCFAFVVFKYKDDAETSIREMDGQVISGCRIRCSFARPRKRGSRGGGGMDNKRCYRCGELGHFSRECDLIWRQRNRIRRYDSNSRSRSRSRGRRSRSKDRRRKRRSSSPSRERRQRKARSYSRSRSRSRSRSPRRSRSRSHHRSSASKSSHRKASQENSKVDDRSPQDLKEDD